MPEWYLMCAICIQLPDDEQVGHFAETIIRGYAVCDGHMHVVAQGAEWAAIMRAARGEV
ncbi:hypothetical protein EV644_103101 [Kribbella orskensis]|uniref:Uncharacterized protein n=1 Tax=Kribbella orskensis TaxID=2512216 RepID=A0ABY2BPR0_9ACTN|nr:MULTISPECIES: hypothetical protein [Kribbella]TCN39813.1 hypothetical protein EV642_106319 [Kribbella sp. VKM Ac-2500]TCO27404.1 hypothetical protein EV644_103101 [Kribbella orskensis]